MHSKDHRAPIHPRGAFRKTMIHDLRKDNNIKGKKYTNLGAHNTVGSQY